MAKLVKLPLVFLFDLFHFKEQKDVFQVLRKLLFQGLWKSLMHSSEIVCARSKRHWNCDLEKMIKHVLGKEAVDEANGKKKRKKKSFPKEV